MATIIQNVNLANTFGEWVNITNEAVSGYNTIYASDFTKPTGTLYLTSPATALSVSNTAAFTGLVDISGQGSLLVRTNAEIQNTIFLTNKAGGSVNSLVLSANGVANINYVNIVGTGLAANVSNNMYIGGTLVITGNTSTSANLSVSKDITGNNQTIYYDLNVGEDVTIGNKLTVTDTSTLYQDVYAKQNLEVVHKIYGESVQANVSTNTRTLSVTGTSFTDYLQANTASNTRTLSVTGTASVNTLLANTLVNTPSVNTNILVSNTIQSNSSVNTALLNVTGTISTNSLQSNTTTNTRTLSVTGTGSVNILQANSAINTAFISITNTANVNLLNSNTNIIANSGTLFAANVVTPNVYFNGSIQGTGPISTTSSGAFGALTVSGNFAINGATIYASNTFILSDGNPFPSSTSVQYGTMRVSRDSANAELRWDNSNKYWSMRDVDNGLAGGWFNRILDANDYTSLTNTISTANTDMKNYVDVANTNLRLYTNSILASNVVNINSQISANAVSANAVIATANTNMKNYVDSADTILRLNTNSYITANAVSANAAIVTANTNMKNYVDTSVIAIQTQISANAVSANAVIATANTNMKNYVDSANTAMKTYTDNAYVKVVYGSQTVNSDLTINGNLTISGTTTTVNATTVETTDSLLKLAKNNGSSDAIDIGFYAPYQTGGATRYTGLFRKSADKYYLAQAIVVDPTTNTISNYGTNYRATLDANFTGGTVSGLSGVIGISDGGTNSQALPTSGGISYGDGTKYNFTSAGTSGYVLTASGSGVPFWTNATNLSLANTIVKRDSSNNFSANVITATLNGNADTVTNGVYTTGNTTISGTKTFANTISGSIDGNAVTATRSGRFDSQSHAGVYWLTNTWDGSYWAITSNHGNAVKVGYASSAGNASTANTAGSAGSAGYVTGTTSNGYGTRTISTSAPTGGSDGDIWYRYI
jgi:hypothetical protein